MSEASRRWAPTEAARQMAEAMPDGVVIVDTAGLIEYVSHRLTTMTGFSSGDLVGRPIETLVPLAARHRHVGYRTEYTAAAEPRPMGTTLTISCLRRDGSSFAADIALSPLRVDDHAAVVASVRDVSERRAAERAQRELESRYRLLVESVEEYAIMLLDESGRVASWNAGAARVHGYSAEQAVGAHFSVFHTPEDVIAGKPQQLLETALRVGRAEDTGWRVRKDGARFYASVSITPVIDEAGTLHGYAKVVHDETGRREARERHQRIRLLEQRERIARDLHDGAIQRIFAVGMNLQATERVTDSEEARSRLGSSIDELDGVIGDLRRYIFGLRDEETADAIELQLRDLVEDLERTYGVTAALEVDPRALARLRGRSTEAMMALHEAVANVGRHAGARTARVSVTESATAVQICVEDDGHGFDPALAAGGFGLANMRARMEDQMGSLTLTSGPEGTTVTLRLPLEAQA